MYSYKLFNVAAVPVAAAILVGVGLSDGTAKTLPQQVRSDNTVYNDGVIGGVTSASDKSVAGTGKVFFPGDHFSRAFPGDHFSPRQRALLEGQGIKSVSDFIAGDAAVIARILGVKPTSIKKWQTDIKRRLR